MSATQRAYSVKAILLLLTIMQLAAGAPNPLSGSEVKFCRNYADIAFVVDVSGSIEGDGKNPGFFDLYVKRFLKSIVQELTAVSGKIQVGLVTFGNQGKTVFPLTSNSRDIVKKIDGIVYNSFGENTNTSGGINVMRTQVLNRKSPNYRPDAAHIAIVLTDGWSTYDRNKTIPSAEEAKKDGIVMLCIGVTRFVNLQELEDIASELDKFDFSSLRDAILTGVFRSYGFVSYVPEIKDLVPVVHELASQISKTTCISPKKNWW